MSLQALCEVTCWGRLGASVAAQAIGWFAADFCDTETSVSTTTIQTLGKRTGLTPDQVRKALKQAKAKGLVTLSGRIETDTSTTYTIAFTPVWEDIYRKEHGK